jgi:hypothetical protein
MQRCLAGYRAAEAGGAVSCWRCVRPGREGRSTPGHYGIGGHDGGPGGVTPRRLGPGAPGRNKTSGRRESALASGTAKLMLIGMGSAPCGTKLGEPVQPHVPGMRPAPAG